MNGDLRFVAFIVGASMLTGAALLLPGSATVLRTGPFAGGVTLCALGGIAVLAALIGGSRGRED